MKNKQPFYVINAVLASVVMFYVLRLSRSGRTLIDWSVIGLVSCALLWNLIQLGRRLHGLGGGRALSHVLSTIAFWIVGLMNTVLIRIEDAHGWKNWLGWAFLLIALLSTIALHRKERKSIAAPQA